MLYSNTISLVRALALCAVMAWLACAYGCAEQARLTDASFTFVYTTNTNAYIEPCGCCAEQAGGLSSRTAYIARQHEGQPSSGAAPVLVLDSGGFSDNSSSMMQIQSVYATRGMELIGYAAVNLGSSETTLGHELLSKVLDGFKRTPVVSANVSFVRPGSGADHSRKLQGKVKPFVRQRVGEANVFITGVTGTPSTQHFSTDSSGIVVEPVFESLQQVFGKAKHGELVVLLVNGLDAKAKAEVDAALDALLEAKDCAGVIVGYGEIRNRQPYPELSDLDAGKPYITLLNGLDRGRGVSKAVVKISAEGTLTKTSAGFEKLLNLQEPDEKVAALMAELAVEATENDRRLHAKLAGEPGQENFKFTGSRICLRCHADQFNEHMQTRHSSAFKTLQDVKEHKNAMCLPCHTVGYGEAGGFLLEISESPALKGVGCESCHGPGTYHRKTQYGEVDGPLPPGANEQGLREVTEQTCLKCHTNDTDLTWDYEEKLPLVDHSGGKSNALQFPED